MKIRKAILTSLLLVSLVGCNNFNFDPVDNDKTQDNDDFNGDVEYKKLDKQCHTVVKGRNETIEPHKYAFEGETEAGKADDGSVSLKKTFRCELCGEENVEYENHKHVSNGNFYYNDKEHWKMTSCLHNGKPVAFDNQEHDFSDVTINEKYAAQKCNVCGYILGSGFAEEECKLKNEKYYPKGGSNYSPYYLCDCKNDEQHIVIKSTDYYEISGDYCEVLNDCVSVSESVSYIIDIYSNFEGALYFKFHFKNFSSVKRLNAGFKYGYSGTPVYLKLCNNSGDKTIFFEENIPYTSYGLEDSDYNTTNDISTTCFIKFCDIFLTKGKNTFDFFPDCPDLVLEEIQLIGTFENRNCAHEYFRYSYDWDTSYYGAKYDKRVCSICGDTQFRKHVHDKASYQQIQDNALNHYASISCICGTREQVLDKHDYGDEELVLDQNGEPTNKTVRRCKLCGYCDTYQDNTHTHEYKTKNAKKIDDISHSVEYTCTLCGFGGVVISAHNMTGWERRGQTDEKTRPCIDCPYFERAKTNRHDLVLDEEIESTEDCPTGYSIYDCQDCDMTHFIIKATDYSSVDGVLGNSEDGHITLNTNYANVSYKFFSNYNFTGRVLLKGYITYFKDGSVDNCQNGFATLKYTRADSNTEISINGNEVQLENTKTFDQMGFEVEENSRGMLSTEEIVDFGSISFSAGENTLVYKRIEETGMYISEIHLVGSISPEKEHTHHITYGKYQYYDENQHCKTGECICGLEHSKFEKHNFYKTSITYGGGDVQNPIEWTLRCLDCGYECTETAQD